MTALQPADALDAQQLLRVLVALKKGDLSARMPVEHTGVAGKIADTLNDIIDTQAWTVRELERISVAAGVEGRVAQRIAPNGASGAWEQSISAVNALIDGMARPAAEITRAVDSVIRGDLRHTVPLEIDGRPLQGEHLRAATAVNTMVAQIDLISGEVIQLTRQVGREGKLGVQASAPEVAGVWRELVDGINEQTDSRTEQMRNIAEVATAIASGDLSKKVTVDVRGEILELKDTINTMVDQLNSFASEVIRVAREVGTEGKLGGQAEVKGVAGIWNDLTDNVNLMANNLTTQVRNIADVTTAVAKGELTRTIDVEAQGEVAELKDNINQMIANLRDTTRKNTEQDWLKTNLARFTRVLQGQRDLENVSKLILSELAPLVYAQQGLFYVLDGEGDQPLLRLLSTYAFRERKNLANRFHIGEGLVGQCALERDRILLTDVPHDYIKITSGLGEATPLNIVVLPVLFEGQVKAVIELASFHRFSEIHLTFLDQLTESIAIVLNTIEAGMRTEELLKQSQSLAEELQGQQRELTETNRRRTRPARSGRRRTC